ncbi:MAG TPA: serine/threonine-protein kinase [Thermoanaerobaculia bacterium]|nr:serine/threonine-protein kinase [Thermoanaerobaculia bacterium]
MAPIAETSGNVIARYRLVERLGGPRSSVWIADDTERARRVAIKILSKMLPADPARRTPLLQKIRQRAALHHAGLAGVQDVVADGEVLILEMERVDGEPLSGRPLPLDAPDLLRLAWQLADTLAFIHGRALVHGALTSDDVLLTPEGDARIVGLTLAALTERPDRGEERLLQSTDPADARRLGFRSPEQLARRGLDARSDLFSLGVVLFEAATGTLPFAGTVPTEVAAAVLRKFPRSPQESNPKLSNAFASVIGKCLLKDPIKRYPDARSLLDELRRIDSSLPSRASRTFTTATRRRTESSRSESVIVVAFLPYFDLLDRTQPAKASRLTARMQQVLGEAALLVDGSILDSLGARFVATVPDADAAISALHHARLEIAAQNAGHVGDGEILEPTILAHMGEITTGLNPGGPGLELAQKVLSAMEPGQILVSSTVAAKTGAPSVGVIEGVSLHALPEPAATLEPPTPTVALGEPAAAEVPASTPPPSAAAAGPISAGHRGSPRRLAPLALAGAGVLALLVIGAIVFLRRGDDGAPGTQAARIEGEAGIVDQTPQIYLERFDVEGTDPKLAAVAGTVELAVREILGSAPGIRIADGPGEGVPQFGARRVAEGPPDQMEAFAAGAAAERGPLVSLSDPGAAAAAIAGWIAAISGAPAERLTSESPEALAKFVEAVAASRSPNPADRARAAAAAKAAIAADPRFVPAARLAIPLLLETGDREGAIAAAEIVVEHQPHERSLRRDLVGWLRSDGRAADAIRHVAALFDAGDSDPELFLFVGRQALSAGDAEAFSRILPRVEQTAGARTPLHAADMTAARGRFAAAAQQYYAVEPDQPDNGPLALKIGRIGVLRHSLPVADLELEKLQRLDPSYGAPLLRAYIAAENRNAAAAVAALREAQRGAGPNDDFHTASAEVYAVLSDHQGILRSLRSAVEAREPAFEYIQSNPLFAYLRQDRDFAPLREEMRRVQAEIRQALAPLR